MGGPLSDPLRSTPWQELQYFSYSSWPLPRWKGISICSAAQTWEPTNGINMHMPNENFIMFFIGFPETKVTNSAHSAATFSSGNRGTVYRIVEVRLVQRSDGKNVTPKG
jgi:hypothetical protein